MKNLDLKTKGIKIIFRVISIIVIIIGLGFSYLIAQLEDAPGVILIGSTLTLVCASFIYGFGEIIIEFKKNNAILFDVYSELKNKNK